MCVYLSLSFILCIWSFLCCANFPLFLPLIDALISFSLFFFFNCLFIFSDGATCVTHMNSRNSLNVSTQAHVCSLVYYHFLDSYSKRIKRNRCWWCENISIRWNEGVRLICKRQSFTKIKRNIVITLNGNRCWNTYGNMSKFVNERYFSFKKLWNDHISFNI